MLEQGGDLTAERTAPASATCMHILMLLFQKIRRTQMSTLHVCIGLKDEFFSVKLILTGFTGRPGAVVWRSSRWDEVRRESSSKLIPPGE